MSSTLVSTETEFRTVDGTILCGRLYPAEERALGVVMSPGFNATRDLVGVSTAAAAFQRAGITALVYDPRGVGLSGGQPNNINPFQQVDDMSDALTFLSSHRSVDPRRGVGVWGMSLGASVALTCAAIDPRARFALAVCPGTETQYNLPKLRNVLAKAAKDRESQIKGNDPFYVPMLTKTGESPVGWNPGFEHDKVMQLLHSQNDGDPLRASLAPKHINRTTVGTYRYMLMWNMEHVWQYLTRPVLFLLAEEDQVIPPERQVIHYDKLQCPKRLYIQKGAKHMDILEGLENQKNVSRVQIEFMMDAASGKFTD